MLSHMSLGAGCNGLPCKKQDMTNISTSASACQCFCCSGCRPTSCVCCTPRIRYPHLTESAQLQHILLLQWLPYRILTDECGRTASVAEIQSDKYVSRSHSLSCVSVNNDLIWVALSSDGKTDRKTHDVSCRDGRCFCVCFCRYGFPCDKGCHDRFHWDSCRDR